MSFFLRETWVCSFLEADLKTSIGRRRFFATEDKLRDLVARTPTKMDSAAKQALEYAIREGRGGIWLNVTGEQYAKLRG